MKTLYLDCSMGAAGDMLTAALLELQPELLPLLQQMGLPGVEIHRERSEKCGISGTHISVTIDGKEEDRCGHSHHNDPTDISRLVEAMRVPSRVKKAILSVYARIAQAESAVHGVPVEQIHFHEVGALDALADIGGFCLLMDALAPERVVVSPIHVGSGQVKCAHGILPVPAPATALLLQGVPTYSSDLRGELCTPTGAALLTHFATEFAPQPLMTVNAIGYGMGRTDFPAANCVRAFLGESMAHPSTVTKLECNLDDMTAEDIAFAQEQLFAAGALEVFTVPVGMKKSRPGTLLCVLCAEDRREQMLHLLFRHTTTIGVRESVCRRQTLERKTETLHTPLGDVQRKISSGYGVRREKFEYEDLAHLARENHCSLAEVRQRLQTIE